MLSHDLARELLARRNNDVRIEVLTEADDGDAFLLRSIGLRDSGYLSEPERIAEDEVVAYDTDCDVVVVRAGFVGCGHAPADLT